MYREPTAGRPQGAQTGSSVQWSPVFRLACEKDGRGSNKEGGVHSNKGIRRGGQINKGGSDKEGGRVR